MKPFIILLISFIAQLSWGEGNSTFPKIPLPDKSYSARNMISQAKVTRSETKTDGYKVTGPDGKEFFVDDIDHPTKAFYGVYIDFDNDDILQSQIDIEINIDIDSINFFGL
ncbi:MAG: hypothetical protein MJK10_15700 [Pseudomonadales bacterium]|nr:hypothetical protein [Pseudomonadales bacterium]NRA17551.1 hypothetical protein [Oceanospirillaceae bacterium]